MPSKWPRPDVPFSDASGQSFQSWKSYPMVSGAWSLNFTSL